MGLHGVATSMSRRTWLVSVSIVGHFAIGIGVFASGIWNLERLEADTRIASIGVMTPSQAGGGAPEAAAQTIKKKESTQKKIPKETTQPKRIDQKDEPKAAQSSGETGTGIGDGKTPGPGDGPGIGPPGGEVCALPPCPDGPAEPTPEPKKEPVTTRVNLSPVVMSALRTSGETQIHPSRNTQNQMISDGKRKVAGAVKVCIQATGAIESATILGSTKYAEYDQLLLEGVRRWHYRPHMVDGVPTPACSAVNFVYEIK